MVFSVVKNRICFRGNTWEENLFPDNNNKVSSSGRKPEESGSNLRHPRRPRGSQSGREKGATKVFKHGRKSPWVPSSETQGQSVGSEKAGQKFASTGKNFRLAFYPDPTADCPWVFLRMPGYRLSPDHFQTVKRMLAPDWAQKIALYCCAQSAKKAL